MALRLTYQSFSKLLGWIVLHTRSDHTKEIEILVLRHQLAVLQRRTPRPRINGTDRALLAALTRLLPTPRRLGLLVTPATILRWHSQLTTRRWTTQPDRPGRPAIPAGLRALTVRLPRQACGPWSPRRARRPAGTAGVAPASPSPAELVAGMVPIGVVISTGSCGSPTSGSPTPSAPPTRR
jgi:putative transposase